MDPVRVPETPDPLPRGSSLFIPFDCFNIQPNGSSDQRIALDLPPKKTHHEAKIYVTNVRLMGRAINYTEYSDAEILKSPQLMNYLALWKGRY